MDKDPGLLVAAFMALPLLLFIGTGLYCGWGSLIAQLLFGYGGVCK